MTKLKREQLVGVRTLAKQMRVERALGEPGSARWNAYFDICPRGTTPVLPPPIDPIWKGKRFDNGIKPTNTCGSPEITALAALKAFAEIGK
ncbi:MAG: hypothetical protein ABII22_04295 [Candidatus Micrarchaeota archaeon]